MFDLNLANTCDNCDKHLAAIHGLSKEPVCDRCLDVTTLRTCDCHEVRYCSRDCQKSHWREGHKEECAELLRVAELSESYGSIVVAQRRSIIRWSKKNRAILNAGSVFALEVGTTEDKSQSHCFLLTVKAELREDVPSITDVNAQVVTDEELQGIGIPLNPEILRNQTNCTKIIVFDSALPQFLGLRYMFSETVDANAVCEKIGNASVNWKAWLMDSVATLLDGGKQGKHMPIANYIDYGPVVQSRQAALETWCGKFGEQFGMAAYSALDLQKKSKQKSTHLLRVHVDAIGTTSPLYKVCSADVITFDEAKFPVTDKEIIYTFNGC